MNGHGPLGAQVDYPEYYDPSVLYPIARAEGRRRLGITGTLPFAGVDIWNAFEMSWLNTRGKPQVACGEFHFPASSPSIVESKSFKLYLNSFNQSRWSSPAEVQACLERDLSAACGAPVAVLLHLPESWPEALTIQPMAGHCLDDLDIDVASYQPSRELLSCRGSGLVEQSYYSHLLRSRCPVTGQPDWASISISCLGPQLDEVSLLRYLVSFRQQDDFHEQCVEQIFCDLQQACEPQQLTVYARYLRRGGLDINPWRSTQAQPSGGLNRRGFRQ
ncbi:NADPH-dependent 7-cyano-7-deazaguanine reductase QueF [Spongiibacter sp.]|uniref:NADPH-dependent 7-cyano-7-deazaguanine reductase QueF n=1 Tax=Spongiibacter sp. TaxID=2024860 RepID=UPI0035663536